MGAVAAASQATSIPCLGQAEWNRLWEVRYARESERAHPSTHPWPPGRWGRGKLAEVRPKGFAIFHNIYFFLITKLVPFILTHLKKLSTGNKCTGKLAARTEALEQLSGSFAQIHKGQHPYV